MPYLQPWSPWDCSIQGKRLFTDRHTDKQKDGSDSITSTPDARGKNISNCNSETVTDTFVNMIRSQLINKVDRYGHTKAISLELSETWVTSGIENGLDSAFSYHTMSCYSLSHQFYQTSLASLLCVSRIAFILTWCVKLVRFYFGNYASPDILYMSIKYFVCIVRLFQGTGKANFIGGYCKNWHESTWCTK